MGPYTQETAERHGYWLAVERSGELELIDQYAQKTGGPILELAAGAARVTKELARRGHIVYGLEMSRPMLEKAREVTRKMDQHIRDRIRLVQGDMTRFAFGRKFPLIVIPFYSFWHNLDQVGADACVRCMMEHLTDDGLFLVEGERSADEHSSTGEGTKFWADAAKRYGFTYRYEKYSQDPHEYPAHLRGYYHSFLIGSCSGPTTS